MTKAAGAEVGIVVTWLAMMLALETSVILKWRKQLAIMAGVGLASATLAVSSPWSRPLDLWRLLVKMGAGGAACGHCRGSWYKRALLLLACLASGGASGEETTGAEFAAPMPRHSSLGFLRGYSQGWLVAFRRTVALAPTLIQHPPSGSGAAGGWWLEQFVLSDDRHGQCLDI